MDERDLEVALVKLGLAHERHYRECPGGPLCTFLISSDEQENPEGQDLTGWVAISAFSLGRELYLVLRQVWVNLPSVKRTKNWCIYLNCVHNCRNKSRFTCILGLLSLCIHWHFTATNKFYLGVFIQVIDDFIKKLSCCTSNCLNHNGNLVSYPLNHSISSFASFSSPTRKQHVLKSGFVGFRWTHTRFKGENHVALVWIEFIGRLVMVTCTDSHEIGWVMWFLETFLRIEWSRFITQVRSDKKMSSFLRSTSEA